MRLKIEIYCLVGLAIIFALQGTSPILTLGHVSVAYLDVIYAIYLTQLNVLLVLISLLCIRVVVEAHVRMV